MNETLQTIHSGKSLQLYDKKPINRQELDMILDSALRAPTSVNMMLYSIIAIEDQVKKEKLVQTCTISLL